jgi:hypothetical protein
MDAFPIGGGFSFSLDSIGGVWKWTVSTSNLQGPGQLYQVQDILTPYGPMNVIVSPLPGDVVQAMAQSIVSVQGQLKPSMSLISSSVFTLGITEGDPGANIGIVQIRNDGGFGSYLSANATPDVPWLSVLTPEIQGIAKGGTASFSITLVPDSMLASQSPYVGHVRIQDVNDSSSFITATVNVIVIPRPAISVSTQNVSFTWSYLTPASSAQYVVVTNSGPGTSNLEFSTLKVSSAAWLSISPASAGPLAAGESENLILSIVSSSVPTVVGTYSETVRVTSANASNSPVDVLVTLTVTP